MVNLVSFMQRFVKVIIRLCTWFCYSACFDFIVWYVRNRHAKKTFFCAQFFPEPWFTIFFFPLQVRLLTGIARFHEMSYIFDTLFEHEHFELLCRRGIDKVTLFCLNRTVAAPKICCDCEHLDLSQTYGSHFEFYCFK